MHSLGRKTRLLAQVLALTAVYFCCGKFGLSLAFINKSASAVWPPTGVALASLVLGGLRLWPGVFLGAFLVNITTQGTFPVAFGIALGNTLEALLGATLAVRFADGTKAFEHTLGIFRFVFFAAMVSTTASATVGVLSLCLGGYATWNHFLAIWFTWWMGDIVSALIIAPVILLWFGKRPSMPAPGRLLEAAILTAIVVWIGQLIFLTESFGGRNYPLEYLAIPPLLWAAFRFGQRGAVTLAFVLSSIALWGTRHGLGPFVRSDPNESLLLLQAFMGTITLTALILASIISARQRAERELAAAQEKLRQHAVQLEQRVEERTARLQESVQSLDSFCYSIAHDLRAPLRAVSGFSNELVNEHATSLEPTARDYLVRIRDAAAHMDRLILDLLKYGRLNATDVPLETVAPEPVIRNILAALEHELNAKKGSVNIQSPLLSLSANPVLLEQILTNLLDNALKFIPPSTPPEIRIWTEPRDGMVRLCVCDNGIGIKPVYVQKLFKPFVRLVNGTEFPGTGIGLAIVRKAAERMRGQAGVESEPSHGSCFWIELPGPTRL